VSSYIPEQWRASPPDILIIGRGPFSLALGQILAGETITTEEILDGIERGSSGVSYVLNDLRRVFIVAHPSQSPADLLCVEEALWQWIAALTAEKEEHRIAIQFILPARKSEDYSGALAAGLSCPTPDLTPTGHGVCSTEDSFPTILKLSSEIQSRSLVDLKNRRRRDLHRQVLSGFQREVSIRDENRVREASQAVRVAFDGKEYRLDLFCNPPCHQNGNRLRTILSEIVTDGVTPSLKQSLPKEIKQILR